MAAWWDTVLDIGSTALDWLDDNEWAGELLGDAIKQWTYDQPEIDYDQLRKMAIQEAVINSPDVFTPQGNTKTTIDPETGKRVVTKEYSPEIDQLYQMLVRNAGAPVDTYSAPDNFDAMMGKYINDREDHMGLERSTYTPWSSNRETGVQGIQLKPASDDEEEDDPAGNGPPGGGNGDREGWDPTDDNPDRYGPDGNLETRDLQRLAELTYFLDYAMRNYGMNQNDGTFDFNAILDEWLPHAPEGTDPSWFEQFIVENGETLGGLVGSYTGFELGGTVARQMASMLIDNYWDNNQWQSPAETITDADGNVVNSWEQNIEDYMNFGWKPQQSPVQELTQWGPNGTSGNSFSNPNNSQFVNQFNSRYGQGIHNSNFDQFGNRIGRSGNSAGWMEYKDPISGVRYICNSNGECTLAKEQ